MIYKTKRFSSKTWEGIKGGVKGAGSGALWGAALAPGNLTAAAMGKPKLALGLTGAGAAVGAYIGGKNGYKNAVNSWKYKNDPEYAKKVDEENKRNFEKQIKINKKISHDLIFEFNLQDWIKLSSKINLPEEIIKYIKFYNTWSKNIDKWYNNLIVSTDPFYDTIPEFHCYFPVPVDAKMSLEWKNYDEDEDIYFLTLSTSGDDGYVCYDFNKKLYGIDFSNETKSLKDLLSKNIDYNMGLDHDVLGPENIKLIQEFKRHL